MQDRKRLLQLLRRSDSLAAVRAARPTGNAAGFHQEKAKDTRVKRRNDRLEERMYSGARLD